VRIASPLGADMLWQCGFRVVDNDGAVAPPGSPSPARNLSDVNTPVLEQISDALGWNRFAPPG